MIVLSSKVEKSTNFDGLVKKRFRDKAREVFAFRRTLARTYLFRFAHSLSGLMVALPEHEE
jgi:hypothetical protein